MIAALLVEATWKGCLLLLAAQIAVLLLRRRAAAVRHAVWTAAILAVLLVGPLALILPEYRTPVPPPVAAAVQLLPARHAPVAGLEGTAGRTFAQPAESHGRSPQRILTLLWAAGALGLTASFVGAGLRLSGVVRRASAACEEPVLQLAESIAIEVGVNPEKVRLRWTDREMTPMTWGILRPVLVLPAACRDWGEERLRPVFVHEIGHIQRWDVLTQALSSLACVVFWFNPLVWAAARRMLIERERACDDLVLRSGAKPSSYAHELLEVARTLGARWTASRLSPAMARRSQISDRLLAVLDSGRSRRAAGRPVVLAVALSTAVLLPALASLAPGKAGVPLDLSAARASVAVADAGWARAYRNGDIAAFTRHYATDCLLVRPLTPAGSGRQAAARHFQWLTALGVADIETDTDEIYLVDGKICELGRARLRNSRGEVTASVRFMTLWKQEEGEWRIFRDFAN